MYRKLGRARPADLKELLKFADFDRRRFSTVATQAFALTENCWVMAQFENKDSFPDRAEGSEARTN